MSAEPATASASATTTTTTTSSSEQDMLAKPKEIRIDAKECPIEVVTVFSDRAEVIRNVKVDIDAAGLYNIAVENITRLAMPDTMHVSGGMGPATLLEVVSKIEKRRKEECSPSDDEEKEKNKARLEELKVQVRNLSIQREVTERTLAWLQNWADKVRSTPVNQAKSDPTFLTAPYIENVRNFGKFFAEETLKHSTRKAQLVKNIDEVNQQISALQRTLQMQANRGQTIVTFTTAVISMAVQKASTIRFQLKYLVPHASWTSAYDCRVSSENAAMTITYFGEIRNQTLEDWDHTRLLLSTAAPSVGGHPGELNQATVSYPVPRPEPRMFASVKKKRSMFGSSVAEKCCEAVCCEAPGAPPPPPMKVLTATASKSLASCTFTINRKASIASDGEKHRVTVTVIPDLPSKLCYVCVPSQSDRVFLKVSTVNKTEFPLLEGPCNTFIDGSFVAASTLKYTAIGEPFKFFLGTDKELKLKYVQPFRVDDKAGLIVKSSLQKFSGSVELRNSKRFAVNVCVMHPLPKADTTEIKVTLLEPKIVKDDKAVKLNAKNFIRWKAKVEPGETFKMPIQYTISYPQGRPIYFSN